MHKDIVAAAADGRNLLRALRLAVCRLESPDQEAGDKENLPTARSGTAGAAKKRRVLPWNSQATQGTLTLCGV